MPDLVLERAAGGIVAGIDEAGRGPWAGPVVAAALVLDGTTLPDDLAVLIDDSKKLSPAARQAVFDRLGSCATFGIGAASVTEIDRINILAATFLAMTRALAALARRGMRPDLALVDGNRAPPLPCPCRMIVGGDGKSLSIAAASIVAKVTRDRIMARLDPRYPAFGWARNAGYGTAVHRNALYQVGVTRHHRISFKPIDNILSQHTI
ncbi:MAG: ribonuclease HII [Alphaproteobacteria bacterium]|nr:ribonuclease HII [Alphaproteobacteria bacterium]